MGSGVVTYGALGNNEADLLPLKVIRYASDLGYPDINGYYTLESGIEYYFVGTVDLGDKGLRTPAACVIRGTSRSSETIRTNRTGPLILTTGGTVRIRGIRLRNDGGPLVDASIIGPSFAVVFQSVALGPCTFVGTFGTSLAVIFDLECTATGLTDTASMVRFVPAASVNFFLTHMSAFGNSAFATAFDLGTAQFLFVAISTTGFLLASGKTIVEGLTNGGNISIGGTAQVLNCPIIGGGTLSNTITPGDARWTIFNTSPSRNSSTFANWGMNGNTTITAYSATDTPILGSGMAAGFGSQRFSFTQQTNYIEAVYNDSRGVVVSIDVSATISRSGGGGVTKYYVSIQRDSGSGYVTLAESPAPIEVDTTDRAVRSIAITSLSQNDKIRVVIRMASGSAAAIVTDMRVLLREE